MGPAVKVPVVKVGEAAKVAAVKVGEGVPVCKRRWLARLQRGDDLLSSFRGCWLKLQLPGLVCGETCVARRPQQLVACFDDHCKRR